MDSSLTFTTGGDSSFYGSYNSPYYYDGDVAISGGIDDDQESWMQTTYSASAGDKVSFFWKVSSESGDDLKFYIDGQLQNSISGEKDWQKKSYSLSAGSRTLKWVYEKDSSDYEGDDCGWVDGLYVGPSSGSLDPEPPGDYAEAVDSSLKFTSSGDTEWAQKEYTIDSGIHTLKWVYDDNGGEEGDNCGYVDYVQWTGSSPVPDSNNCQQIEYKYDVYGRRSEKKVDGRLRHGVPRRLW